VYGAGRGSGRAWTALFDSFQLGGEQVLHNRLRVGEFELKEADMLLGIDFFLSHHIYVSQQQSKMFMTYAGGTVFALNKSDAASPTTFDAAPAAGGASAANGSAGATADQLARRGAASAAHREFESALADLNRACELDPSQATFFATRGHIEEALKRPAKALDDFDKALQLDPTQADARIRRAWLRSYARDRDGAKADLDELDKTLAPQAQMRLSVSNLYTSLDQLAQALVQLNLWLAAHPNEFQREAELNSRCWTRLRLGVELDKALDDCNRAIDADSKNPNYLDSRAWVQLRLGHDAEALADFDRSLKYRPDGAWSLYGRGLTKTRLGDAVQGAADLAAARKAQPDIDLKVTQAGLMKEPAPKP
jgi:tetratricopeptide (TPR) repeat protein